MNEQNFTSPHFFKDVHRLNEIYKSHRGRNGYSITKSGYSQKVGGAIADINFTMRHLGTSKKQLDSANSGEVKQKKVRTDFHNMGKRMDQGTAKDYWSEPHEMFARAFESFVYDKLKQKGQHNDFLANEKHNDHPWLKAFGVKPYPEGDEKKVIDAAMEEFFEEFKKHKHIEPKSKYSLSPHIIDRLVHRASARYGVLTYA